MNETEWLDELERLRKAAIMPPYYLRKKLFFGEDEEEYYITVDILPRLKSGDSYR